MSKKKIIMFMTDSASYKTYLDLKNYLNNNNYLDAVDLSYFYFDYSNAQAYPITMYNTKTHIQITRDMENDYTNKEYGYAFIYTLFMETLMSVLKNYIHGKEDLLDIDNSDNIYLNTIDWNHYWGSKEARTMTNDMFNSIIKKIPKADLYLISNRLDINNSAGVTIEIALALYLIRKYNSKVFIGGGHFNQSNNIIVELINAIGKEYTNGQLEYVVGTIGINVYNYLKGYEYQNKYTSIERNFMPLKIRKREMNSYFHNTFPIELIRGCSQKCPYCCNGVINKYDRVDISIYNKYFQYLNENYPNSIIYLYAPELNTDKEYFINTCKYLYKNVKNPLSFYINLDKMDDRQFNWLLKLNLAEIRFAIDGLLEKTKYRKWSDISSVYKYLNKIQDLHNNHNLTVSCHMVANSPGYNLIDWKMYKDIFMNFHDILTYSEFYLLTSVDYFHHPEKYGISFLYYQNRYKELFAISSIINQIPVMYFRNDINRKEMVNKKYDILRHMKKQVFIDITHIKHNTNVDFILNLMSHIYPDLDLIDEHDYVLDKYIKKHGKYIGYKLKTPDEGLSHTLHRIF